jgi:hypothetical protein
MPVLISLPILGFLIMFQSAVVSRIHLLQGTADLVLLALAAWTLQERVSSAWQWSIIAILLLSLVTALPLPALAVAYLAATALALVVRRHVWQVPILAMLITTFAGTLIIQVVSVLAIWLEGTTLPLIESLNLVLLPSLLLNLLLAIPIYAIMGDLANWLHPKEIEV